MITKDKPKGLYIGYNYKMITKEDDGRTLNLIILGVKK